MGNCLAPFFLRHPRAPPPQATAGIACDNSPFEKVARHACDGKWIRIGDALPEVMATLCVMSDGRVRLHLYVVRHLNPRGRIVEPRVIAYHRVASSIASGQTADPVLYESTLYGELWTDNFPLVLVAFVGDNVPSVVYVRVCKQVPWWGWTTVSSWSCAIGTSSSIVPFFRGTTMLPCFPASRIDFLSRGCIVPPPKLLCSIGVQLTVQNVPLVAPGGVPIPIPLSASSSSSAAALVLPDLGSMLCERERARAASAFWTRKGPAFRELQEKAWAPARVARLIRATCESDPDSDPGAWVDTA